MTEVAGGFVPCMGKLLRREWFPRGTAARGAALLASYLSA
jgi:hypothetical protein